MYDTTNSCEPHGDVRQHEAAGVVGKRRKPQLRHGHARAFQQISGGGVAHRARDHAPTSAATAGVEGSPTSAPAAARTGMRGRSERRRKEDT